MEEARVFFPVTCMTRAIDSYNVVNELSVQPGRLTIDVHERAPVTPAVSPISVLYHLDGRLALQDARWADDFVPMHATLYQRGELDHALSAPEVSLLRQVTIIRRPHL